MPSDPVTYWRSHALGGGLYHNVDLNGCLYGLAIRHGVWGKASVGHTPTSGFSFSCCGRQNFIRYHLFYLIPSSDVDHRERGSLEH